MEDMRHTSFPLSWVTTGQRLLLVGGGSLGQTRLETAIKFDWHTIHVVADDCTPHMEEIARVDDRVQLEKRRPQESDIEKANLVIESTMDNSLAAELAGWCEKHRVILNAMDKLDYCNVHYPAFLTRGPLIVAISSGGEAPAISARLRRWLEEKLGMGWCHAACLLAKARRSLPAGPERMEFLKGLAQDPVLIEWIESDNLEAIQKHFEHEASRLRNQNTASQ